MFSNRKFFEVFLNIYIYYMFILICGGYIIYGFIYMGFFFKKLKLLIDN